MPNKVKGIPDNSSRVIARLVCTDGAAEIDFCVNTFDAVELNRRPGPDGMMAHALLTIGPEMIMIPRKEDFHASECALDKHDRHRLNVKTRMRVICTFVPPLVGGEIHDAEGSYPADEQTNDRYCVGAFLSLRRRTSR